MLAESGLCIYQSKLLSHDGVTNAMIGGPHESFDFFSKRVGGVGQLMTHFIEGLARFRQGSVPRIGINPACVEEMEHARQASLQPREIAGEVCCTPKIDVAIAKSPTLDFSSVCRGRVMDKVEFYHDLAPVKKVNSKRGYKRREKKPGNVTTGSVQTKQVRQEKMDLDIEVIPDQNNLIESATTVLKEPVQQLGVPSGMPSGVPPGVPLQQRDVQVIQQELKVLCNDKLKKTVVRDLVPVDGMVIIESLDGKEITRPIQEVDDDMENIAMAAPIGEVINRVGTPEDQALSVVCHEKDESYCQAYVGDIASLREHMVKHVKVAEEDLDDCETESVEMSTPVEEGHAVVDKVFKGDVEQYQDDETAVENSPREYDDILWELKESIRQSSGIGGVPMDIAADQEEGVPSELKKCIKQPGVPPSVDRCNVQEADTIGLG